MNAGHGRRGGVRFRGERAAPTHHEGRDRPRPRGAPEPGGGISRGKVKPFGVLTSPIMVATGGKVNLKMVNETLRRKIK